MSKAFDLANVARQSNVLLVDSDINSTVLAYDSNLQNFIANVTLPISDGTNGQTIITDGSGNLSFTNLTTANIAESGNLYYTDARVYSNVTQLNYITSSSLNGYATNTQLSSYALTSDLTTSNVAEGTNLYFTNTRAIEAFTEGTGINIDANGLITVTATGGGGAVDSVNGYTGVVVLSTSDIAESGNLYFTNARSIAALSAGQNITIDANGRINSTATGGGGETGVVDSYARTLAISALNQSGVSTGKAIAMSMIFGF